MGEQDDLDRLEVQAQKKSREAERWDFERRIVQEFEIRSKCKQPLEPHDYFDYACNRCLGQSVPAKPSSAS